MTVRVRIAPSPTGHLHVGNARSALFNWLFARHEGGTFIVRIDDTDQARSEQQYEDDILSGLRWLGLDWDEGVEVGGPHGTYRQSDRFDRYAGVVQQLLDSEAAYYSFRSSDELDELRTRAQKEGKPPGFYIRGPEVDVSEARERVAGGENAVVRLSIPQQAITFHDLVRGDMEFSFEAVDDFVIARSDGTPTYHLASTVDDIDYEISHVARGEDLLSSTPKHIALTRAIGATPPQYAHLPLLFGPDGKKLSKRHGDTSLRAYREHGFLPEAMFNYMSLLGWSLDAETTIFSREQAVAAFELTSVSKNPAVFDPEKLSWMNGMYMREMEADDFVRRAVSLVENDLGRDLDEVEQAGLAEVAPLIQERVKLLDEIPPMVRFLYVDDVDYDEASWRKTMKADAPRAVGAAIAALEGVGEWDVESIESALRDMLEGEELSARKGLQPLRVAVSGSSVSPPLFESMAVLGRDRTMQRLAHCGERLAAESSE